MYYAILFRPPLSRAAAAFYNEADLSRAFSGVLYDESRLNFGLCATLKGDREL